ncbi:chromate transporter [Gracilinema caldarium]|uniref:Chromate transporter n=1 Tax=Gracilinema caldarium (strain ATCC 51460 / DSM 7334 / H1) TaxID=744872 RepID=F8F058_GRAC1|nr:chromate transporter [Gracilinema caldarium]AEJ18711.1 Chromate transporter [Gracilinema caldarium DSM 7334]
MKRINSQPHAISLFWLFAWINTITLGGGYVIIPVIGNSLEKRGWMDEETYYDIFAQAQAYPGPLALSTSLLVGIRLCGFWGAAAAFFGVILPPFLVIILVSRLLTIYGSLPIVKRFLEGAGAVVPGIVAAMVWKNGKRLFIDMTGRQQLIRILELTVLTIILVLFPRYSLPILLGGIASMYILEGLWKPSK